MRRFGWRTAKSVLVGLSAGVLPCWWWARGSRFPHYHRPLAASLAVLLTVAPSVEAELDLKNATDSQRATETAADWEKHWAVAEGFSLELDTQGYHYPTAIAFVPNPGSGPKDPLYFVTELRGKVKVVTNDRTIYTFAEDFLQSEFYREPPKFDAEFGLAGICLAPAQGYVFVTFAYQLDDGSLRNNIIRFNTTPGAFALEPKSQQAFTQVFAPYESGLSHQIGNCDVHRGMLHVGVGDGYNSSLGSQRLDTFQGKVLRMTLDGEPASDNPFYESDSIHVARNYIWAYGLRNPFGLNVIGGKVIVAENGINSDRFMAVEKGRNYLWDGGDNSIMANADYVFVRSIGPVQMDFPRRPLAAFPEPFDNQFYVAMSANDTPGIMRVPYSMEEARIVGVPGYLLKGASGRADPVTGLAFGPDGLYFAPIMPSVNGQGAVFKIKYEPRDAHPITLEDLNTLAVASADPVAIQGLMHRKGCFGCHEIKGTHIRGGTKGPPIGGKAMIKRIEQRISSPGYFESLQELNARDEAPFDQYDEARNQIVAAEGLERVRLWTKYQILEPRFDGPASGMPGLGLAEGEAEAIAGYLTGELNIGYLGELKNKLFRNEQRRLTIAFASGVLIGLLVWFVLSRLTRLRRRS